MKIIVPLLICLFSILLAAQTKPVAFRSHSGNIKHFSTAEPDNLGLPPNFPVSYEVYPILSPLQKKDNNPLISQIQKIDTTTNNPYCNNPEIQFDSLKILFPFYSSLVDFEKENSAVSIKDSLTEINENLILKNELNKKSLDEFSDESPNNKSPELENSSSLSSFIIRLSSILLVIGTFIWLTNRKKITTT